MGALFRILQRIAIRAAEMGLAERLLARIAAMMGRAGQVTWSEIYLWVKANPRQIYKILVEVGNVLGLVWLLNEIREILASPSQDDSEAHDCLKRFADRVQMSASHTNTGAGAGPDFVSYPLDVNGTKAAMERVQILRSVMGGSRAETEAMVDALRNTTDEDFRVYDSLVSIGLIY